MGMVRDIFSSIENIFLSISVEQTRTHNWIYTKTFLRHQLHQLNLLKAQVYAQELIGLILYPLKDLLKKLVRHLECHDARLLKGVFQFLGQPCTHHRAVAFLANVFSQDSTRQRRTCGCCWVSIGVSFAGRIFARVPSAFWCLARGYPP